MPSQLLKKGSPLYHKRTGPPDLGLKAQWAGSAPGPDVPAPFGTRDKSGPDRPRGAPARAGSVAAFIKSSVKNHTGPGFRDHRVKV